jgi:hypothetical protein
MRTARRFALPLIALLTAVAFAWPPRSGTMTSAGEMQVPRAAHTATSLNDGRVLIAGGFAAQGREQNAEIYDPQARRFVTAPAMHTPRHSHAAVALADGRVLILGGYGAGSRTLDAAEIFDPATNRFVPTGSLVAARANATAVALTDGRVLVVGGLGPDFNYLASAELYDPQTGRFTATGAMSIARTAHAAVRLADGRVLVSGGHRGRRTAMSVHASADVFDPATGQFTRVGDMRVRRHKHDLVLLPDGRVLVTAGSDERDADGKYTSTELFDPRTGRFEAGPTLQRGRFKHIGSSVTLANGKVLIAGGAPQAEVYDPQTRRFELVAGSVRMAGQFSAVALLPGGGVLITGGYADDIQPRRSAWRYDP